MESASSSSGGGGVGGGGNFESSSPSRPPLTRPKNTEICCALHKTSPSRWVDKSDFIRGMNDLPETKEELNETHEVLTARLIKIESTMRNILISDIPLIACSIFHIQLLVSV